MNHEIIGDMFDVPDSDNEDDECYSNPNIVFKSLTQRKRAGPNTLKRLVISHVANNINYWMGYLPENPAQCLYVISPFDTLSMFFLFISSTLAGLHTNYCLVSQSRVCYSNAFFPNGKIFSNEGEKQTGRFF